MSSSHVLPMCFPGPPWREVISPKRLTNNNVLRWKPSDTLSEVLIVLFSLARSRAVTDVLHGAAVAGQRHHRALGQGELTPIADGRLQPMPPPRRPKKLCGSSERRSRHGCADGKKLELCLWLGYRSSMKILGIDFTSRPSRRKPITCIHCTLDDSALRTQSFEEWPSYERFEAALAKPGPWIAGIDFPFARPAASSRPSAGPHPGPHTFTMLASLAAPVFVRR